MNKDVMSGKINDALGRIERQAGEWRDDDRAQARGAARQVKGKLQQVAGKLKNATKSKKKEAA